ncbi:MAG: hypothetical protein CMJ82_04615 [Planctomycetaceae bacterium]|nr:hypothetical protein [Planctomycetaceae bacterium]
METLIAASFDGFLEGAWNIGKVLMGLGFVIFVHELGHFLVAKACGVQCDKFYVGFDVPIKIGPLRLPAAIFKFQWGETEYGIGTIPLGGYVKMLGQDDNPNQAEQEAARIRTVNEDGEEVLNPRSYPAKNVPQRMAIISAGVIMNLIFGILMAAAAYKIGTPIQPAAVGGVTYGSAAWKAGWESGYDLVGFSESDEDSFFYRFTWDLKYSVIGAGMEGSDAVPFRVVDRQRQKRSSDIVPVQVDREGKNRTVGITMAENSTIASLAKSPDGTDEDSGNGLLAGDEVIEIDGKLVSFDGYGPEETRQRLGWEVRDAFALNPSKPLAVKVLRDGKEVGLTVPALPMKGPGFVLGIGPITAFQQNSKAAKLGFQIGDVIEQVNGSELATVGAIALPQFLAELDGQDVTFGVRRESEESSSLVEIEVPSYRSDVTHFSKVPNAVGCITSLGLAYTTTYIVTSSSNPTVQVGDELIASQYVKRENVAEAVNEDMLDLRSVSDYWTWFFLHSNAQYDHKQVETKYVFERDGVDELIEVIPVWEEIDGRFNPSRGVIQLQSLQRIHQVDGLGEAMTQGWIRTKQDLQRVGQTLGWIADGTASVKDLGGPVMIMKVAQDEAAQSVTRLLLFLTMLSANLAILNFLPIPVLDGGHFVFLTIELITRKPVSERIQGSLSVLFLFLLLGFMLFVVFNDISRLFF